MLNMAFEIVDNKALNLPKYALEGTLSSQNLQQPDISFVCAMHTKAFNRA
jgi:hypothetical protein